MRVGARLIALLLTQLLAGLGPVGDRVRHICRHHEKECESDRPANRLVWVRGDDRQVIVDRFAADAQGIWLRIGPLVRTRAIARMVARDFEREK